MKEEEEEEEEETVAPVWAMPRELVLTSYLSIFFLLLLLLFLAPSPPPLLLLFTSSFLMSSLLHPQSNRVTLAITCTLISNVVHGVRNHVSFPAIFHRFPPLFPF